MVDMTHLSLFTGIGGLDLAAEWAGFRTVGQCEWADYPRKVLEKHWPELPRWRDIRTLTKESFYEQTRLDTVTVLSGGFPCQPFSTAGKRRGKEDDRYLWPEMLRVIQEIRPSWVVGENVAGIVSLALDTVLSDLESIGYACQAVIIPACAVDAPHRRDRVAIVGYANHAGDRTPGHEGEKRTQGSKEREHPQHLFGGSSTAISDTQGKRCGETRECISRSEERTSGSGASLANTNCGAVWHDSNDRRTSNREIYETVHAGVFGRAGKTVTNADCIGLEEPRLQGLQKKQTMPIADDNWWTAEPNVGRVAHGIPFRVDRLRCLGNAVVPQWAFPIFRAIAELERQIRMEDC